MSRNPVDEAGPVLLGHWQFRPLAASEAVARVRKLQLQYAGGPSASFTDHEAWFAIYQANVEAGVPPGQVAEWLTYKMQTLVLKQL